MKTFLILLSTMIFSLASAKSIYDFELPQSNDKKIQLSKYKNNVLLIVNIATRCGYTGQLGTLEKLYQKYKAKGFMIVGVPSNEFMGQSPENNKEIVNICQREYGVTFPIGVKQKVKGSETNPLYKYLKGQTGNKEIGWNFEKFLISKEGKVVKRFKSSVEPLSSDVTKAIESLL